MYIAMYHCGRENQTCYGHGETVKEAFDQMNVEYTNLTDDPPIMDMSLCRFFDTKEVIVEVQYNIRDKE